MDNLLRSRAERGLRCLAAGMGDGSHDRQCGTGITRSGNRPPKYYILSVSPCEGDVHCRIGLAATKLTSIDGRLHGYQAEQRIPFRDDGRTGSSAACATKEQNTRATRGTASPTRHCRPYPVPIRSSVSLSQLAMQSLRRQNCPSLGCSVLRVVLELAWVDLCWRLRAACGAGSAGSAGISRPFGRFSSLGLPVAWAAKLVRAWPPGGPWLARPGPAHWMPRRPNLCSAAPHCWCVLAWSLQPEPAGPCSRCCCHSDGLG